MLELDNKKKRYGELGQQESMLLKQYDKVCDKMDGANREAALFNCLKIPSDDVKLAVVNCLYYVPVAQIDRTEYRELFSQMYKIENIGVGQIELVLSKIFMVFCKILGDTSMAAKDSVDTFKQDFVEDAISLGLQFLIMNQKRVVTEEDEEGEKTTLSLSIVNFFKYISKDNTLNFKLLNIGVSMEAMNKILIAE